MSNVSELFQAAGVNATGVVRWGTLPSAGEPGVYAVALTPEPESDQPSLPQCPLRKEAIEQLILTRQECRVDELAASPSAVAARLSGLWLPDEVVVYIGLAGTSIRRRVGEFYRTRIGARAPHAGGWPLKMLSALDDLWVHFAICLDPEAAERAMLSYFAQRVSEETKLKLHDATLAIPFANLKGPTGRRKQHGISGACEARAIPSRLP